MSIGLPLLRAPPFPWVSPRVAAISHVRSQAGGIADDARLDALIALIRACRIGGNFWSPPATDAGDAILLRPRDDAEHEAFAQQAEALALGAPTFVIPADAAIDPWSLLKPSARLIANEDDEWVWLAAIAGATVIGADPVWLRAGLARRLIHDVAYRDCFFDRPIEPEAAAAILADWRRQFDANRSIAAVTGISWWKKQAIERFLWTDRAESLVAAEDTATALAAAGDGGGIATWPSRAPEGLAEAAGAARVPIVSIEDGFIRSIGLGAGLHPPQSIVVDRSGIYYDPASPSDLETLLATTDFPPALLARAAALRETIVASGISKYASDPAVSGRAGPARTRRTVLVAGQVEDDMSVRCAGGAVAGNLDLLRRAHAAEPGARILFKPHPDVDAGHRAGKVADADLLAFADEIVRRESMASLLARIDAVHVLTSQTGFEALLRGVETIVHGRPFYVGWGLTTDLVGPIPRRTRRLTRDELVAATLILYPRYLDPETELPCPPEVLLDRFAKRPRPRRSPLILARRMQGLIAGLFGKITN